MGVLIGYELQQLHSYSTLYLVQETCDYVQYSIRLAGSRIRHDFKRAPHRLEHRMRRLAGKHCSRFEPSITFKAFFLTRRPDCCSNFLPATAHQRPTGGRIPDIAPPVPLSQIPEEHIHQTLSQTCEYPASRQAETAGTHQSQILSIQFLTPKSTSNGPKYIRHRVSTITKLICT